jgi:hypothetical protein
MGGAAKTLEVANGRGCKLLRVAKKMTEVAK